ncbi:succinyl-diaminopimelate desuccinylase [Isoptericola sp. b441]|uniref:Succinyl-diaminopimelate desuccinylase n=1 Tax=Actinotalea lenta TaxID=3064654 RepID=A0ABT9D8K5_9CELL|nr:succinyl-diaminopimelate desuccinylase [Isoptericola sp. b441]MDO8106885.1 succinyl-diaminopimelate desuccinylase [Isoptericola sp. b441]
MALDLSADLVTLTRALCDVPSVSGAERQIADLVHGALSGLGYLEVLRDGDAVVARTHLARGRRVVLAGHLDTVPVAANLPSELRDSADGPVVWGRGTVDMKGGVAVLLALAAAVPEPSADLTYVFYDAEEVEADRNGLGRLVARHPDWVAGDMAVLGEPTAGALEGGCNGTLRVEVVVPGRAAHSARSWLGVNAVHGAAEVLHRLVEYRPREVDVDGLVYREGLNAVGIRGGVAGNVIPDECVVTVNYRFAPSRSEHEAFEHVSALFDGYEVRLTDSAPGARPGLDRPEAAGLAAVVAGLTGRPPRAKQGWTDVARFAGLGVPAVNFGPGDPSLAHADDEHTPVADLTVCFEALRAWLTA